MPKITTCKYNGKKINVIEALNEKDRAKHFGRIVPKFMCTKCGERVRVHRESEEQGAHFEHLVHNDKCSYSQARSK